MTEPLPTTTPIATLLLLLLAGCGEPPPESTQQDTAAAESYQQIPTRAALPRLFDIMQGLEAEMQRISAGIWAERFDSIARGAHAIASHRRVAADEQRVLRRVLGDDLIDFNARDDELHDLAVQLQEDAERRDLAAVVATESALRAACVRCHVEFRQRLRDGVD